MGKSAEYMQVYGQELVTLANIKLSDGRQLSKLDKNVPLSDEEKSEIFWAAWEQSPGLVLASMMVILLIAKDVALGESTLGSADKVVKLWNQEPKTSITGGWIIDNNVRDFIKLTLGCDSLYAASLGRDIKSVLKDKQEARQPSTRNVVLDCSTEENLTLEERFTHLEKSVDGRLTILEEKVDERLTVLEDRTVFLEKIVEELDLSV